MVNEKHVDQNRKENGFPSSEKFEDLMKTTYDTELARKETLDEKSMWMMEIAAIVATLYGGFGIVTATGLFSEDVQLNFSILVLVVGVILLVACIFVAAKAFLVRTYRYAADYTKFVGLDNDNKTVFDEYEINEFRTKDLFDLGHMMIKSYLSCIVRNHEYNEEKATDLIISQIIFFAGLVTVPLFVILTAIGK